jgi:hypothetical protein
VLNYTAYTVANFREASVTLSNQSPATYSEAPKEFSFTVNASNWAAVAMAPTSNYNLEVDDDATLDNPYATSSQTSTTRDFVAVNGNTWGDDTHYARVLDGSSTNYTMEAVSWADQVNPETSTSSSMGSSSVTRVFQADLASGTDYQITARQTSGTADLAVYVFAPSRDNGLPSAYDWKADAGGSGQDETMALTAGESGTYGIVVINQNGAASEFDLSVTAGSGESGGSSGNSAWPALKLLL